MDKPGKLRILLITMLFPNKQEPEKSTFMLEMAKRLSGLAEIKIIAPVRAFPLLPSVRKIPLREEYNGFSVYHPRVFLPPKFFRFLHGFLYFLSVRKLAARLSGEFDLILSPYLYPDGFAGVLTAKSLRKPVAIEARGCDVNLLTKYRTRRALIRYACKNANAVVTVNRALKERLVNIGVEDNKISVIQNGVDNDNFKPLDKKDCRLKLGLPLNKKIVLFVGSLEKVKGVTWLIEAWRDLVKTFGQEIFLILIGEGREKNKILQLIRAYNLHNSILMAGIKPHSSIPLWMNSCDVFTLPSIREGCPNVLLEALSCNKYVVASRVGGIPEIIKTADAGILVEPANAGSLSAGLKEALLSRAFNHTNKTGNLPLMSWEKSALERVDLFKKICA